MADHQIRRRPSPIHRTHYYLFRGGLIGGITFAIVGAICGAIGYELQVRKTYDLWFHIVNAGLTIGFAGAAVGLLAGAGYAAIVKKRRRKGGRD